MSFFIFVFSVYNKTSLKQWISKIEYNNLNNPKNLNLQTRLKFYRRSRFYLNILYFSLSKLGRYRTEEIIWEKEREREKELERAGWS